MVDFRLECDWFSYPDDDAKIGETTAQLKIHVDGLCLTRNEDAWSRTVRDHVIVSMYPLAMWFASTWWRLNHEILPCDVGSGLDHDWLMSHQLTAANMGFIWPNLVLVPDRDEIHVLAQASQDGLQTPVKYLNGLNRPRTVPKKQFVDEVSSFINQVVARLHETGQKDSELAQLWALIMEDQANLKEHQKRRIEAGLGFDPDDCPERLIKKAISLERKIGVASFSELAGAYAGDTGNRVDAMNALADSNGIVGKPDIPSIDVKKPVREPWELAVSAAHELRSKIGKPCGKLLNDDLYDLLGLTKEKVDNWAPSGSARASVAGSNNKGTVKFVPRKTHPVHRRFEFARIIGDYARKMKLDPKSWVVTADLLTARQKFQRAFAAEFLCPISALVEQLDGDFSESAVEGAASHFIVSEKAIDSILKNNGYISRYTPEAVVPSDLSALIYS